MKNKKYMARLLTMLLTAAMIVTSLGISAFADDQIPAGDLTMETVAGESDKPVEGAVPEEPQNEEPVVENAGDTTDDQIVDEPGDTQGDTGKSLRNAPAATIEEDPEPQPATLTVKLNTTSVELTAGKTKKLTATASLDGVESSEGIEFTWKTSKKSVATVSKDGKVSAQAKGSATITVTATKEGLEPATAKCKVTVTPKPVAVDLEASVKGENKVTLTWNDVDADSYEVFCDGKSIKKLKSTATSYKYQCKRGEHKYYVKSYFGDVTKKSKTKTLEGKYLTSAVTKMKWMATFKKNAPLYSSSKGGKKIKTVKKGTKVRVIGIYPKRVKGFNKPRRVKVTVDGKTGWATWRSVKVEADVDLDVKYTKDALTKYANKFKSSTSYVVWVNEYTQKVYVFKGKKGKRKLVKSFRATTGNIGQPISHGLKTLGNRRGRVYRLNEKGTSYYFYYARGFHGSGYFHTPTYWTSSGRLRMGLTKQPTTRGCIRMVPKNAKYIYNLPRNTRVVLH